MKKISMILLFILTSTVYAAPGDGTLPVIRHINIDFQEGQLQRDLRLPNCINLGIKPSDIQAGGSQINATLQLDSSRIVQEISIRKNRGVIDLSVSTKNSRSQILDSTLISVSESEFHNSVKVNAGEIQQTIQINGTSTGCVTK
ncbi:MAG: hypothetical protein CME65_16000 [Halobacteriovoraceae bacterium]|nr:hypothetical protein [Halobacteriovoraceae bacterium]|tara:strand:- start:6015 stop:6446 length:432 start_codon:yes stop_codon:yes gene_type:complete